MGDRQCDYCASTYYVRPSTLALGFGRYCSKSCSNRANNPALSKKVPSDIEQKIIAAYLSGQSKAQAGLAYGYGRGGVANVLKRHNVQARTISEALTGRVFTDEVRAKISANHADVSGENNPMFGKAPGMDDRKVWSPTLNTWLRSTWELTVSNALISAGIAFTYETERIILSDRTYMPDFYLPDTDMYIEVKGWRNARFEETYMVLLKERPDIRLLLIERDTYYRIANDPRVITEEIAAFHEVSACP